MSWFKPKHSFRRVTHSVGGGWGRGKRSLRNEQKMLSRLRETRFSPKFEKGSAQRVTSRRWGVGIRQWLTGRVERGFLLTVGFFIVLKNGGRFLLDLLLSGWELATRRAYHVEKEFDTLNEAEWDGNPDVDFFVSQDVDLELDLEENRSWDEETAVYREEVEMSKISTLATEEKDLSRELLDDQAGALRSRLAAIAHERIERID